MDWKGRELVSEPPAGFKKGADRINSIRMHPTEADAYFMLPCAEKTAAPGWGWAVFCDLFFGGTNGTG
jgi:hypothetical protein